jgi:hypothetical protein
MNVFFSFRVRVVFLPVPTVWGSVPVPRVGLGFVVSSMKDRVYVYPHENEFVEAMCSKLTNYHCSQGRHGP